MKVLVTGGAGCIGSELAASLLKRGDEVTVFDNLSSGKFEHIEPHVGAPGFRFVEGDMLDAGALNSVVRQCEIVYHLSANPDVKFIPGDPTDKDLNQNTLATYHLLEAMRVHGVRAIAFSSTSAVYGLSPVQPIPEDMPARPISLYGATKLSCEALIGAFQHLFGFECWIFRFANVVGAKVRKKGRTVISDFIYKLIENPSQLEILGNGLQAKSYLSSADCVSAMNFVVDHARAGMNIYNLGCEDSLQVNRIAQLVVDAMGLRNVKFTYTGGEAGWLGDVPRFQLDVRRLGTLGWKAGQNSEQAVAAAIREVLAATPEWKGER